MPGPEQKVSRVTTTEDLGAEGHYAPGDRPLCGAESWIAVSTDDPALVRGSRDCLELVAEDEEGQHETGGRYPHCGRSGW